VNDKQVLITGATNGIGLAAAEGLAALGANRANSRRVVRCGSIEKSVVPAIVNSALQPYANYKIDHAMIAGDWP